MTTDAVATKTGTRSAVTTRSLTRRFGPVEAVSGLDLEVPRGRITGFLGPNGAGKTTTLRMLLGLLRPDAGTVEIFGRPPSDRATRARVGALIETPALYPHLTGTENLEIDRRLRGVPRPEVARVLDFVGLTDAAERAVGGYSLGMRQRLGLALALLGRPELLILDEPTNGLDPAGIAEMRRLLRELADGGTTVLLSSHLLAEIEQIVSHLIVLRAGRGVYQGSIEGFVGEDGADRGVVVEVDRPDEALARLEAAGWRVRREPGPDVPDGLESVDGVGPAEEGALRVDVADRDGRAAVCRLLVEGGHAVSGLRVARTSLERAFVDWTIGAEDDS